MSAESEMNSLCPRPRVRHSTGPPNRRLKNVASVHQLGVEDNAIRAGEVRARAADGRKTKKKKNDKMLKGERGGEVGG